MPHPVGTKEIPRAVVAPILEGKERTAVKFSTHEEFQVKAHECFGRIFELLVKVDDVVKKRADEEEAQGRYGEMSDMRDWMEEIILQCHLAWQYHRLSRGPRSIDTWDHVEVSDKGDDHSDVETDHGNDTRGILA